MTMKSSSSISVQFLIHFVLIQLLWPLCVSQQKPFGSFDLVLQWPGSYTGTKGKCSDPIPADFGIHGLWPADNSGKSLLNCDPTNHFNPSSISDIEDDMNLHWADFSCGPPTKFWAHEWEKHGTCSLSVLNQKQYFRAALELKKTKVDLLHFLDVEGIKPDGKAYKRDSIKQAIEKATGYEPKIIQCNSNGELYQIYICVDKQGKNLMQCPVPTTDFKCGKQMIKFPIFKP